MKTINKIVKTNKTKIAISINVDTAPVLPSSNVVTNALGISATIPANIINFNYFVYCFYGKSIKENFNKLP